MKNARLKHALLIVMAVTITSKSRAQDYYHAFGLQANVAFYNLAYTSPTNNYSGVTGASVPGIFYKATFGLGDVFSVSAYPFFGLNLSVNSRTGSTGGIGFSLPVNFELHTGTLDDACFFGGAGFNYSYLASIESGSGSIVGPEIALGGQFYFREQLVGLRASYTIGLNKTNLDIPGAVITTDKRSLFTIGIFYPIGQ